MRYARFGGKSGRLSRPAHRIVTARGNMEEHMEQSASARRQSSNSRRKAFPYGRAPVWKRSSRGAVDGVGRAVGPLRAEWSGTPGWGFFALI